METGNSVKNEALVQSTSREVALELIKNKFKLRMSVRLKPDGISFLLVSVEEREILYFANYYYLVGPLTIQQIETCLAYENVFFQKAERIDWSWTGLSFSLVPEPLFDPSISAMYLDFNKKIEENDIHKIDTISFIEAKLLYSISKKFHQIIVRYAAGDFKHMITSWINYWLKSQKPGVSEVMVYVEHNNAFVALANNQNLILINQFDYSAPEDLAYHLLYCMEQYSYNPERVPLWVGGMIEENDKLHKILCKFIRNVEFIEPIASFEMHPAIAGDDLLHSAYPNLCALL